MDNQSGSELKLHWYPNVKDRDDGLTGQINNCRKLLRGPKTWHLDNDTLNGLNRPLQFPLAGDGCTSWELTVIEGDQTPLFRDSFSSGLKLSRVV